MRKAAHGLIEGTSGARGVWARFSVCCSGMVVGSVIGGLVGMTVAGEALANGEGGPVEEFRPVRVSRPQANVGLTAGVLGRGQGCWWSETRGFLGVRGDVMFGRAGARDWGVGPFGELVTAFDDIAVGVGVAAHVPVHEYLPFVVSVGGYVGGGDGAKGGVTGSLFWGSRSYNHNSWYVMSSGLFAQGRVGLFGEQEAGEARDSGNERAILLGVQVGGEVLAMPVMFLWEAIGG